MTNEGHAGGSEWLSSSETKRHFLTLSSDGCQVGLYGWRRRCLFLFLTILIFLAMLNLVLTLWILKVMEFSSSGLGPLSVFPGGAQLRGEAMVLDTLTASKIRSRKGQAIQIESNRNISLNTRGYSGKVLSQLHLGEDSLSVTASALRISDPSGKPLFTVDKRELRIDSESLLVTGEGGAVFEGSLQTPKVKADSGHELRLESPTKSLNIFGTFGVNLVSGAGDISVTALEDIKIQSQTGAVKFETRNIYLPKLETVRVNSSLEPRRPQVGIYQVCICQKGRLFLAPPDGDCVADNDVCR